MISQANQIALVLAESHIDSIMAPVKTTVDLPDDLMRQIKVRAAQQDRKLKDVLTELLRRGLGAKDPAAHEPQRRVQLPLIRCAHPARIEEEMTPSRVAELLMDDEAQWALKADHGSAV